MTLISRPLAFVICISLFLILIFFIPSAVADQLSGDPGDAYVFGADSAVDPFGYSQYYPVLTEANGRIYVIWEDNRPVEGLQNFTRIFYRDITDLSPGGGELPPSEMLTPSGPFTGSYKGQDNPAADGDLVAWEETVTTQSGGRGVQIYYTYLGDPYKHPLSPNSYTQHNLDVSGTRVVWQDERAGSNDDDIYMYDLATGQETPIVTDPGRQISPRIDGDWVVWISNDNYINGVPQVNDLFAKNLATGEVVQITDDSGTVRQASPSIEDGMVAWTQSYYGMPEVGIYIFDLSHPEIQPQCIYEEEAYNPEIERTTETNPDGSLKDGYRVVWSSSSRSSTGSPTRVMMADLSSERPAVQTVTAGQANVYAPVILGDRIAWYDSRSGQSNIYQNRLGERAQELANEYAPELHFFHDFNQDERNDVEPRTVNLMVDNADRLITASGDKNNPSIQDLIDNPGEDSYLDLPGSPANPFHSYEDDYKNQLEAGDYPITAYAQVVQRAEETDKTVIQYWFNYYYNNWYNNHEGDWEMVEVILNDSLEPEDVAYSQHGSPWKKGWNEWGLKKTDDTHPQVFVAEGSHASYFIESNALHFLEPGTPNAFSDITGSASQIIPPVDLNGLAGGWVDFGGHWGQEAPTLCPPPFCDDGPKGPAFQEGDPFNQPLTWANSSFWKGLLNDSIFSVFSPAEINLYDAQGRHVGKNAQGGIDLEIPGSEYFEREDDHSKNIVIHNSDILSNYTVEIEGTDTGTMDLKVQVPDFGGNMIENPQYLDVEVNPAMQAELDLSAARDFDLKVDEDGDGSIDIIHPPDANDQVAVDFTPPATVTDLAVEGTTSGTATLNWTAPGDDGAQGTAFKYDLRYSTEPITGENWQYATPVDSLPDPQVAGATETATVTGLDAGTTYYFAIKARDDSWQESTLSNVAQSTTEIPNLTWDIKRIYWASWDDYYARQLSIDYNLGNSGTGQAISPTIAASICSPSSVYVTTPLPLTADDLNPGSTSVVTLKYYVPSTVGSFTTTTYANCLDDAGRNYWFPGPLP